MGVDAGLTRVGHLCVRPGRSFALYDRAGIRKETAALRRGYHAAPGGRGVLGGAPADVLQHQRHAHADELRPGART